MSTLPPLPPVPSSGEKTVAQIEQLPALMAQLQKSVEQVVVGQNATVEAILVALITRGHCLLTGVPGLAKTLLVKVVAHLLGLHFSRVQFTPDLMPSDITGTDILEEDAGTGHRKFVFVPGPIFTQVLLADEINRTPPKTQAALLEAMQEKTVTLAGKVYAMHEPFLVLATQNPIEQEGTYPLPEAQLDRFLFELPINYPSYQDEVLLVEKHSYTPMENLAPLIAEEQILALREAVTQIPAPPNVVDYAVRLVRATRPEDSTSPEFIKRWIRCGASPRASQNLILAGRARAALHGRFNVACEDIAALAIPVLRHRLIRSFHADADNKSSDQIIQQLIGQVGVTDK
ncbi:MAG TPA: MoxR family ATPase [Candidatus Methylacidiphilales bacterium]|jgi:MoxR-like ATPase|nr:MoxR family ATPase [Candidatus Methylacidiphilales bacterium]